MSELLLDIMVAMDVDSVSSVSYTHLPGNGRHPHPGGDPHDPQGTRRGRLGNPDVASGFAQQLFDRGYDLSERIFHIVVLLGPDVYKRQDKWCR